MGSLTENRHRILLDYYSSETVEGNPVSFSTNVKKNLKECVVELSPKQDLNGYDHPWSGGAGKNKYPGIQTISLGGNNARTQTIHFDTSIPAGTYYISAVNSGTASDSAFGFQFHNGSTQLTSVTGFGSFTVSDPITSMYVYLGQSVYDRGETVILSNIQIELGTTATEFEPYSNICPIDSWGGKNLLPINYDAGYTYTANGITFTVNDNGGITVNGTATSETYFSINIPSSLGGNYYFNGCPSGGRGGYDIYCWDNTDGHRLYKWDGTTLSLSDFGEGLLNQIQIPSGHSCRLTLRVYSGKTVDNIVFHPMICSATTQDPTWQPYRRIENIVSQTGKNFFKYEVNSPFSRGGTIVTQNDDGSLTFSGTAPTSTMIMVWNCGLSNNGSSTNQGSDGVKRLPNGRYYMTGGNPYAGFQVCRQKKDGTFEAIVTNTTGENLVIINDNYTAVWFRIILQPGATYPITIHPMIRLATETDDTYEPYNPTSQNYTVTWENDIGEVFGGSLNLTTGEMVSEWIYSTFNNIESKIGYNTTYFYITPGNKLPGVTNIISSVYATTDVASVDLMADSSIKGHSTNGNIYFKDSRYTSKSELLAEVGDETVCYKLATPITYHLTPVQIKTLLETNVLTTDGDNIRVTYWKH